MNSPQSKEGTVCFLIRDSKVLLLHLEYPNGRRVWSGVGGMRDEGESLEDGVIREGKEELDFRIDRESLKKMAIIQENPKFKLTAFIATHWEGEPTPSEDSIKEIRWFSFSEIPYDMMWQDNKYWLPKILEGQLITAEVLKNVYEDGAFEEKDIKIQVHQILPEL